MKQFSVQSRLLSALLIGFSLLLSLAPASLPVLAAAPEAVTPTATLTIPPTVRIGESFSFAVTFDNTGTGTETGYGPYIDLFMPQAGVDGTTRWRHQRRHQLHQRNLPGHDRNQSIL